MDSDFHRGENCRFLLRFEDFEPADCRCAKLIDRYADPRFLFLTSPTWVPVDKAARILSVSVTKLVNQAKAGQLPMRYRENVSRRVTVWSRNGAKDMTIREAVNAMGTTEERIEQRISAGELQAYYLDEHIEVQLVTRWQYEKCPLWGGAGICIDFDTRPVTDSP